MKNDKIKMPELNTILIGKAGELMKNLENDIEQFNKEQRQMAVKGINTFNTVIDALADLKEHVFFDKVRAINDQLELDMYAIGLKCKSIYITTTDAFNSKNLISFRAEGLLLEAPIPEENIEGMIEALVKHPNSKSLKPIQALERDFGGYTKHEIQQDLLDAIAQAYSDEINMILHDRKIR